MILIIFNYSIEPKEVDSEIKIPQITLAGDEKISQTSTEELDLKSLM